MRRREFIVVLGGAASWPVVGRAQEAASPVVGWIGLTPVEVLPIQYHAVHRGLAETGAVAGRNLVFEQHSVDYHLDRMPGIATELVRRRVSALGAGTLAAALAAKAATQTIPIVFVMGTNPVERGIVPSLARPGGNITGVTNLNNELIVNRLEILREVAPSATLIAFLVNPMGPPGAPQYEARWRASPISRGCWQSGSECSGWSGSTTRLSHHAGVRGPRPLDNPRPLQHPMITLLPQNRSLLTRTLGTLAKRGRARIVRSRGSRHLAPEILETVRRKHGILGFCIPR
jgi:ABC transporter substrate binding protein